MTKSEKTKLLASALAFKGQRRYRFISVNEIEQMGALDRKRSLDGKGIRIYSDDGFVPSSYKYPASIDYIERYYDGNGNKRFRIGSTGASRPDAKGPHITVNGRAY